MKKINNHIDKERITFDIISSPVFKALYKDRENNNYELIQTLADLHSFIYSTTIAMNTILLTVNSGLGLAIFVSNLKNNMEYSSFFIGGFILSFVFLLFSAAAASKSKHDTIKCIYTGNTSKSTIYKNYTSQLKIFVFLSAMTMSLSTYVFIYGFFSIKEILSIAYV